ncbi:CAP domain-containing protein [Microvirga pakistanensis]|uniref:CAP domain-containing protein n=1 Tax=Microvirga pakistanensis TaxID=1682650 RepID=UPI00106B42B0|nr:CAP domain-containing protein [Microvirga pakistanensis]
MAQATAYEQLMLELVNSARAKVGAQPLAFNGNLNTSADSHTNWMIATDTFSHTGVNGSTPTARMKSAGYVFSSSWSSAENIAWASTRSPTGYQDEVQLLHSNLMNSPGHKANILNGTFREIGIGFNTGAYKGWNGAFVTENFARSGSKVFLTGVTMDDKDGDRFYDVGEALGSITVTAVSSTGARYSTISGSAGGYSLALAAGTYKVTYSAANIVSVTKQVTIGASNVKLDLIDPTLVKLITGTASANTLYGSSGIDLIKGGAGADKLYGRAGNDTLRGETGNDTLYGEDGKDTLDGGAGNDILSGGAGADVFRFAGQWGSDRISAFQDGSDRIDLRGHSLSFSALSITQGNADSDGRADDVFIKANGQTITLLNVQKAMIGAADFLF